MHQQFALTRRRMVIPSTLKILRDIRLPQPRLALINLNPSLSKRSSAHTQRLHFRARQYKANLKPVLDEVIMRRALIASNYLLSIRLRLSFLRRRQLLLPRLRHNSLPQNQTHLQRGLPYYR